MDSKQFKEAAFSAVEEIVNYYDTIEERRVVSNVEPGYLRKLLPSEPPQEGEPWKDIQADIEAKIMPGLTHWQHPSFHAFFPAASSFPGMLGELYSAAFNGAMFNWICSPAVTELETVVLDWLCGMLALPGCFLSTGPTRGGGVIHGTASEAIVTVVVAARDKYLREATASVPEGEERDEAQIAMRGKLVALGSAAAHSSTKKAALIAGVRFAAVPVRAEDGYAMTRDALARTLDECAAKGWLPFYLTATVGTTDTCAVDDLAGIAALLRGRGQWQPGLDGAEEEAVRAVGKTAPDLWVHVDAAYAGVALICPEYQSMLGDGGVAEQARALAAFHSFNTNLHKWLLTNFDCSCLWVRSRTDLTDSLTVTPHYLRNPYTDGGLVTDYRDWQIPLGRRFRSLKAWFVVRTYGVKGLQAHVRKGVALGELFAGMVAARPDLFEVVTGPKFALTVFRVVGGGGGAGAAQDGEKIEEGQQLTIGGGAAEEARRNELTRSIYEAVNAAGKIYLTSTLLNGKYCIRVVTSTPFVEEQHVRKAFDILVEASEKALKG